MRGDSLYPADIYFVPRNPQQAQVFLGEDGAQTGCNGRITRNLQRAAAVDGYSQVAEECDAGWAGLDVSTHLFAGARLNPAIQILREIRKQFAALSGA